MMRQLSHALRLMEVKRMRRFQKPTVPNATSTESQSALSRALAPHAPSKTTPHEAHEASVGMEFLSHVVAPTAQLLMESVKENPIKGAFSAMEMAVFCAVFFCSQVAQSVYDLREIWTNQTVNQALEGSLALKMLLTLRQLLYVAAFTMVGLALTSVVTAGSMVVGNILCAISFYFKACQSFYEITEAPSLKEKLFHGLMGVGHVLAGTMTIVFKPAIAIIHIVLIGLVSLRVVEKTHDAYRNYQSNRLRAQQDKAIQKTAQTVAGLELAHVLKQSIAAKQTDKLAVLIEEKNTLAMTQVYAAANEMALPKPIFDALKACHDDEKIGIVEFRQSLLLALKSVIANAADYSPELINNALAFKSVLDFNTQLTPTYLVNEWRRESDWPGALSLPVLLQQLNNFAPHPDKAHQQAHQLNEQLEQAETHLLAAKNQLLDTAKRLSAPVSIIYGIPKSTYTHETAFDQLLTLEPSQPDEALPESQTIQDAIESLSLSKWQPIKQRPPTLVPKTVAQSSNSAPAQSVYIEEQGTSVRQRAEPSATRSSVRTRPK